MRALVQNMNIHNGTARWGNEKVYFCKHPPEIIEDPDYFLPCQRHVQAMDEIKVLAEQPDGSWLKAWFVVLWSEPKCVIVKRDTDWTRYSLQVAGVEIIDRGNETFDVVETGTGRTLKAGTDSMTAKGLAHAYASRPAVQQEGPDDPDLMTPQQVQKRMKELTGSGFKPGTDPNIMRQALKDAMQRAA